MAGKSTISITFKLDGEGKGFKDLSKDAEGFKQVMRDTIKEAQQLNTGAINFAAIATGIDQAQQSIQQLQAVMKDLTDAYAVQEQAERQLETVMRQRMNATDADIQAIKDLASAQQEIGVIGDEVQLAGAQQVATFLNEKSSIETLLPAMNDLLAQQKGLNATSGDAVSIANLMGKAMQGQTSALKRVGISFNETQEKVMQYGTESQRAAMLAEIIRDNVGQMNSELAKTDSGKQKKLENTLGDIKEKLGSLVSGAMPFVTIAANTAIAVAGMAKFVVMIRTATGAIAAYNLAGKGTAAMMVLLGLRTTQATAVTRVFSAAMTTGAYTATALKIALRGLMIATGVGAVIAGLTMVVEAFCSSTDEASESVDDLVEHQSVAEKQARKTDEMWQRESATVEQARAVLELNIQRLKQFNGTKAEEKKLVGEMNDTYGETIGYFSSVADWYDALVKNSEAYCRQMIIEARARMYANQIAQKEEEIRKARETGQIPDDYMNDYGQIDVGNGVEVDAVTGGGGTFEYWVRQQEAEVRKLQGLIQDAVAEANSIHFDVKGAGTRPGSGGGGHNGSNSNGSNNAEKTRLQEISTLIDAEKNKYITATSAERAEISKKIQALTAERKQIELLQKQAERPAELNTLQAIDDEIAYQQALRREATAENLSSIDSEIERLNKLRKQMEQSAYVPVPTDKIGTYEQLNRELSHYNELLQTATETERTAIQQQINALNDLKDKWDAVLNELKKPGDISTLDSIDKLEDAISYYQDKQRKASSDEVQNIQRTINALDAKRKAMQRGIELLDMQREADEINALSGKEYRLRIKGIGFDELTKKIKDLQKQLNDLDNPVTATQRKDIERLIGTYESWRATAANSFSTYKEGWDGIKGIGNSIQSISDALEGNGNAWQKTVAIVDGFLGLYEGIKTVVGIIDLLSMASTAHAVAKGVEAGAETTEAGTRAAATAVNATASAATIAANKLETASWAELAAAMTIAAHAYIPFVGTAIAAGYIATQQAMILAAGIPKFADGAIAYGPTLGLFGEYAGASNNPEVVAPLDKLRSMIQPSVGISGEVEFKIKGRRLSGILTKENNITRRS